MCLMDTLGERLRAARTAKNLSQDAVARALETSRTVVTKWENNDQVPRLETLQRLASLYEVGLEQLTAKETGSGDSSGANEVDRNTLDANERLMKLAEELSAALKMREENERLRIERVEAPRAEAERIAREAERAAREAEKAAREAERVGQENLRMLMMQLMGTPRGSSQPGGGEPVEEAASTTEEKVDAARG